MKKFTLILAVILLSGLILGCAKTENEQNLNVAEPDAEQIRSICNLATLECYYNNVAKGTKSAGSGLVNIGEVDREFWVEYTGIVKVGIDMKSISIDIDGENITVFLPPAEILGIDIVESTLTEESFISTADGLNKNKITAEDQTQAIKSAQDNMRKTVQNNSSILSAAQNRAQDLIENYINMLGDYSNIEYKINWVFDELPSDTTETEQQK